MDEARAVVADFCEKNPYLLGALRMTWFGCGPFARMVDLGARGAKEMLASEARMKMGL